MGKMMSSKFLKTIIFIFAGITAGIALANFSAKDFKHASIIVKRNVQAKPIHINDYKGKQVLALSLKIPDGPKDIEVKMKGAEIQSWYPPPVKMPFYKWMDVDGGRFHGVEPGKRLPLYLIIRQAGCKELEIIDSSDSSIIQTVHVMRGGANAGHH